MHPYQMNPIGAFFNVFYYTYYTVLYCRPAVLLLHLKRFKAEEVPAQDGDGVEMVFVKNNVSD
jgi:hypothetical protein